ncbi:hypothetical protein SBDP1_850040 [Syntrophobacter sp. SbD1]|nr:hypothetical protein SBDP1_850040 [Syntrophobacter sp. SbD1]
MPIAKKSIACVYLCQKGIDFIEAMNHPAGREALDEDLSIALGEHADIENGYYPTVPG